MGPKKGGGEKENEDQSLCSYYLNRRKRADKEVLAHPQIFSHKMGGVKTGS